MKFIRNIKKLKGFVPVVCIMLVMSIMPLSALAHDITIISQSEVVPVIPEDTTDWSNIGEPVYTYTDDGFIIQSFEASQEELNLGKTLQNPHVHTGYISAIQSVQSELDDIAEIYQNPDASKDHFNLTPHTHTIRNISYSTSYWEWRPTQTWTRNDYHQGDGVTVAWETHQSTTASVSTSLTVGVTDSIVTAEVGANYTKSHTVSTSFTRTYPVPFMNDGRVRVTFERPRANFTCVTTYFYTYGLQTVTIEETGSGSALGAPSNIVAQLERRPI